jgi:hypothetical protein
MNKYVIISSILSAIVTWIFMYLDAKLFDTPKSKFTYFKGILFVTSLVASIVYFMTLNQGMKFQSISGNQVQAAGSYAMEDMITGMPPF